MIESWRNITARQGLHPHSTKVRILSYGQEKKKRFSLFITFKLVVGQQRVVLIPHLLAPPFTLIFVSVKTETIIGVVRAAREEKKRPIVNTTTKLKSSWD